MLTQSPACRRTSDCSSSEGGGSAFSSVASITTVSSLVRVLNSRGGLPRWSAMLYAEDFSSNTVQGACPEYHGIGKVYEVTKQQKVPDPSLTIRERAIAAWPTAWYAQQLRDVLVSLGYDVNVPWRDLPQKDRDWILFTDERPNVPLFSRVTLAEAREAMDAGAPPAIREPILAPVVVCSTLLRTSRVHR